MPTASEVIYTDPDILGGTPVFVGTRVPLRNLLNDLGGGDSLDDFPSVSRSQAIAAQRLAGQRLIGPFAPCLTKPETAPDTGPRS